MDASIAVKPVFDRFQSVVITSGVGLLVTNILLSNLEIFKVSHESGCSCLITAVKSD